MKLMATATPHYQELYDWLRDNRPDILEWCKDQARWHRAPLDYFIIWKEDRIREMMNKPPRRKADANIAD